jgi:hypothetical protein
VVLGKWRHEAMKQIVKRHVVVPWNNQFRLHNPFKEASRLRKFRMARVV